MTIVVTLLAVVVAVLVLLVAGLLRSHAAILRRLHELGAGVEPDGSGQTGQAAADDATLTTPDLGLPQPPVVTEGRAAADLEGTGPHGEAHAIRVVGARSDTVLAFLS